MRLRKFGQRESEPNQSSFRVCESRGHIIGQVAVSHVERWKSGQHHGELWLKQTIASTVIAGRGIQSFSHCQLEHLYVFGPFLIFSGPVRT